MSKRINSETIISIIMILNIAVLIRNIDQNKSLFLVAIEGHRKKYLVRIKFDIFLLLIS